MNLDGMFHNGMDLYDMCATLNKILFFILLNIKLQ